MNNQKNWHIVVTHNYRELEVARIFKKNGFEVSVPLSYFRHEHNNNLRWHQQPLFPTLVFVYLHSSQFEQIQKFRYVNHLLFWLDSPAIISTRTISVIQDIATSYADIELVRKKIVDPASENPVIEMKEKDNTVFVTLSEIGYQLIAFKENLRFQTIFRMPVVKNKPVQELAPVYSFQKIQTTS